MKARTLLLLGSGLMAGSAAWAANPPPSAPTSVRAALLGLLEQDARSAAPPAAVGAVAAPPPADALPASMVRPAPTATIGEPFRPRLWAYFTDTGILASDHGKKVTRELTFGPCTDGELLNQRYYW